MIFVLKYCSINLFRAALYKLVFVLHEDALFHHTKIIKNEVVNDEDLEPFMCNLLE
jgi:hypothetical protein